MDYDMSYSRYYQPPLKAGVDIQLANAYNDGNWPTIIRLAEKRAKSLNDPYYEALKVCAEAQLDAPAEKFAALFAVDALVRKGTAVPSLETLELYEWGTSVAQDDSEYSETLGVLRSRWVKANPKNGDGGVQCLRACLQRWDLVNAQQIAASLDKFLSASGDHRYMFWNIVLTYLLSISPQCHPSKQKILSMLAIKQLERAADLSEAGEGPGESERRLRAEEDYNIFFKMMAISATPQEFRRRVESKRIGAIALLSQGRKDVLVEALGRFEKEGQWDAIFELAAAALDTSDPDGKPSLLASDSKVWRAFIIAAGKQDDDKRALTLVRERLSRLIGVKSTLANMYSKVFGIALLELIFRTPISLLPNHSAEGRVTPRLQQLALYVDQNYNKFSLFDDIRPFVEELSFGEAIHLILDMTFEMAKDADEAKRISLAVLRFKLGYLLRTCPQSVSQLASTSGDYPLRLSCQCRVCGQRCNRPCRNCLADLIREPLTQYKQFAERQDLADMLTSFDQDPRLDLTSVVISVLLTLSGLGSNRTKLNTPPLHNASMAPILQATLLLDLQVKRFPADVPLRLLLIQLYLLLGCASIAHQLWTPLDVKRTILDALAPLFFDRLGSIAPGLFIGARPVIEPVLSHYNSVLSHSYPLRVWDAFSSGSYASILDIVEYDDRLRRSCTMVMAIVEDRRATRAFGGKMDGAIDEVPLVATIDDETILMNATDYGSFPNLESSFGPPLHDIVRLGPHPSNERSHLALLAERFLDLVTFKAPKDYKPTKVHEVAAKERAYNVEILSQLSNSFVTFLHADAMPNSLTDAEHAQYTILSLLSSALLIVFSIPKTDPLPPTLAQLTATLRSSLESFRDTVVKPLSARPDGATADGQPSSQATDPLFLTITDPHSLSTLRDVALAVRHGASFALSFHDREAARDRTGKSNLHKESVAELRALGALATLVLTATKARAKEVKDRLGEGGWLDRVAEWTLGAEGEREGSLREGDEVTKAVYGFLADGEEGGSVVEEWAGRVVESWQEGWKGLGMVKMDV